MHPEANILLPGSLDVESLVGVETSPWSSSCLSDALSPLMNRYCLKSGLTTQAAHSMAADWKLSGFVVSRAARKHMGPAFLLN